MVNLTFIFVGKAGLCRVSWIGSEMSSSSVYRSEGQCESCIREINWELLVYE